MNTESWLVVAIAIAAVLSIAVMAGLAVLYADYRAARRNPPIPPGRRSNPLPVYKPDEALIGQGPPRRIKFGSVESGDRSRPNPSTRSGRGGGPDVMVTKPEQRLRCPFCKRMVEGDAYLAGEVRE